MNKLRYAFCAQALRRTYLHDYHLNTLKAKMVPFAGYEMPVQYPQGVLKEHLQVRQRVGIFDVSHMGQVRIYGPDQLKFIELVTTGDIRSIYFVFFIVQERKSGDSLLCLILNKQAGIIDDTIITRRDDHVHMVVNGGNKFIDLEHMKHLQKEYNLNVEIDYLQDKPLLAIQGPEAAKLLSNVLEVDLSKVPFMNMQNINRGGVEYQINRCGYTGEDGFEVSVDQNNIVQFCDKLLKTNIPIFCGLGSRDSLRIEAGLCLHGHEMDVDVSPVEAKLMWTIRNESSGEELKHYGYEALQKIKQEGVQQKRIGFIAEEGIIRAPGDILNDKGEVVGKVNSGTYSPILKKGLGMGSVMTEYQKLGTKLIVMLRGKQHNIIVNKTPFVPNKYYRSQ